MPTIDTVQKYNKYLGCCCSMPLCPLPSIESQSREVTVGYCGQVPISHKFGEAIDSGTRYSTVKFTRTATSPSGTFTSTTTYTQEDDGSCSSSVVSSTTGSPPSGPPSDPSTWTWDGTTEKNVGANHITDTYEYSDESDLPTLDQADDILLGKDWVDDFTPSAQAFTELHYDIINATNVLAYVSVREKRYRWVISDTHKGSYFKIWWDLVYYLNGDEGDRENNTIEWTGPGSEPSSDDSWRTDWTEGYTAYIDIVKEPDSLAQAWWDIEFGPGAENTYFIACYHNPYAPDLKQSTAS